MKLVKKSNYSSCLGCQAGCCNQFHCLKSPAFTATEFLSADKKYGTALPEFKKAGNFFYPVIKAESCSLLKSQKGCQVYPERPFDCKLFPFSIMMKKEIPWLVLYWSVCCKKCDKKWINNFIAAEKSKALELASSYGDKNIASYALMQSSRINTEKFVWVCKILTNK